MKRHFLVCAFLLFASSLAAQPPAPPNPAAPTLNPLMPLGAQRGTGIDLTLTGTNLTNPTGVWASFPAKITIPTDAKNGTNPASLRVRLDIPQDAPLGFHTLRVATRRGMSNARLFCIDELPQVLEAAGTNDPKTAQQITPPCVVVGTANAEATDYYRLDVAAGQRLSFEVLGRRLGSVFDPQLTLLDAASGKELPGAFSNDSPGLQTDARLTYTFKQAGKILVAIRDVSYRGGGDYHYRLRIGDFPCATTPLPLAVKRGAKTTVRFAGPSVEGVTPVEIQAPTDPAVQAIQVAPRRPAGPAGWPVLLHLSELDEVLEKEPNNDPKQANRLTVPCGVTGRFETKDDLDRYVFTAKKGQRWVIEAHTIEHLSPTEVYMKIENDKGAQVSASNPNAAPRLDFTAPADGDYTLAVEHLHSWGGPEEVYRISIASAPQDFEVTLNLDRWDIPAGGSVSIPIFATRNGYTGPIEVHVAGAKGLSGTVTIPAGPAKPANVPSATLEIKAAEVPPGPLAFVLEARATINGKPLIKLASTRALLSTAMGNLAVPPLLMTTQLGMAVTDKPPFTVAAKLDAPMVQPGKPITATVTATRQPGFDGEIAVTLQGLPAGAAAAAAKISAKQKEVKVTITLKPNVKVGQTLVTFQGAAKHDGRNWTARSAPVPLVVKK